MDHSLMFYETVAFHEKVDVRIKQKPRSSLKTEGNKVTIMGFPTCVPVFFGGFRVHKVDILSHLTNVDALEHFLCFFTRGDHNKLYLDKATGCLSGRGISLASVC